MTPRFLRTAVLGSVLLALSAFTPAASLAQDGGATQPDSFPLRVQSVLCETAEPTSCSDYVGAAISVTLEDGTPVDSCVTEATPYKGATIAVCVIPLDFSTRVIVSQDPASIPPGYEVEANNVLYNAPDLDSPRGDEGPSTISFISYRTEVDEPESTATTETVTGSATMLPTVEPTLTETLTPETDGSNAAIYAGDCGSDFTDAPVATLTDVRPPAGETQGAADASAVETSFTTLDLPVSDILAVDHVLVVFDEDDDTVPLACGSIGGIVTEDGTLAFGLAAVNDSRFSGVAFLTEDGEQTDATIFLAEDLNTAPDATPAA